VLGVLSVDGLQSRGREGSKCSRFSFEKRLPRWPCDFLLSAGTLRSAERVRVTQDLTRGTRHCAEAASRLGVLADRPSTPTSVEDAVLHDVTEVFRAEGWPRRGDLPARRAMRASTTLSFTVDAVGVVGNVDPVPGSPATRVTRGAFNLRATQYEVLSAGARSDAPTSARCPRWNFGASSASLCRQTCRSLPHSRMPARHKVNY
jgi:hypothetical protein